MSRLLSGAPTRKKHFFPAALAAEEATPGLPHRLLCPGSALDPEEVCFGIEPAPLAQNLPGNLRQGNEVIHGAPASDFLIFSGFLKIW